MVNPQLLEYIQKEEAAGITKEDIIAALVASGWRVADINEAFSGTDANPSVAQIPVSTPAPEEPLSQSESVATAAATSPAQSVQTMPINQLDRSALPPVQPVMSVPQTMTTTQMPVQRSSAKRIGIAVFVVILLVLLGGAGAFAYFTYLAPPSPIVILKNALQNTLANTTFTVAATSTGSISVNDLSAVAAGAGTSAPVTENYSGTVYGSYDRTMSDNAKLDMHIANDFSFSVATSSGSLSVGSHIIVADKQLYINLSDFRLAFTSADPSFSQAQFVVAMVNGFASSLENNWVKVDSTVNTVVPVLPTIAASSTALQADADALQHYFAGTSYVQSATNVGTENLDGVPTYHLKVSLLFGKPLADLLRSSITDAQPSAATNPQYVQEMQFITTALNQQIDLDLWIGKNDYNVYKVIIAPLTISDSQIGLTVKLALQEMSFGSFNQPVSISAPAGARSLQDVISGMFGGAMQPAASAQTSFPVPTTNAASPSNTKNVSSGAATQAAPVSSAPVSGTPSCSLSASPNPFSANGVYTLSWTSSNASQVKIVGSNGINVTPVPNRSDSEEFGLGGTWTMTVSNDTGASRTCTSTVTSHY